MVRLGAPKLFDCANLEQAHKCQMKRLSFLTQQRWENFIEKLSKIYIELQLFWCLRCMYRHNNLHSMEYSDKFSIRKVSNIYIYKKIYDNNVTKVIGKNQPWLQNWWYVLRRGWSVLRQSGVAGILPQCMRPALSTSVRRSVDCAVTCLMWRYESPKEADFSARTVSAVWQVLQ